jgi:hypothetical protein
MVNNIRKCLQNNKNLTINILIILLIVSLAQFFINYYIQKKFFLNNKIFISYKIAENNFIKNPNHNTYERLVCSLNLEYYRNSRGKYEKEIDTVNIDDLKNFATYIEERLSCCPKKNQQTLNEAYKKHIEDVCKSIKNKN